MATLNVLLKATAKDKGVSKFFRDATKAADKFTASVEQAARAGRQLEGLSIPAISTGGRRRGGGAQPRPRADRGGGRGRDPIQASLRKIAKDRARTAKRQNREAANVVNQQIAAGRSETRILQQQARERQRQSRQIKNLSQEQLEAVELEREINNRRRRAARSQAKQKLGPDQTPRAGGAHRRFETAENLAVAAGEFEQVADRIDQGVRASNDAFRDFQKGVAEIDTLEADITIKEIEAATKDAALAFGTLPTEQTAAFYAVVSAGATDAAGATEQLTAANRLGVGGVASTEEAVLAISKGLANFSSQGETATSVADKLFGAVQLGQVTVSEMSVALPKVAQTAGAAGLSLSETNAALAVLSKQSGSAKLGATNLDEALRQLIAPTEKADEVVNKLNRRLRRADKPIVKMGAAGVEAAGGLEGFLVRLKEAGATDKDLKQIFGGSGFKAIRGLTESLADTEKGFGATTKVIEDSEGLSLKASNKIMQTASKRAEVLDAKMELLKIQAGEGLLPVMEKVAEVGGDVVEWLTEAAGENPRTAKTVAALAVGVLVLTRAVGALASGMSIWNTISGIAAAKTTAVTAATTKGAASATAYGKATTGASKGLGLVPGVALAATAAIVAFNFALEQAEKPLAKFEERITDVATEQQKISFGPKKEDIDKVDELKNKLAELDADEEKMGRKGRRRRERKRKEVQEQLAEANKTLKAAERPAEELERERLNRQIAIVNAARQAEFEAKGGGAGAALAGGDIGAGVGLIAGGALGRATGVTDELTRQREQAERDLARLAEEQAGTGALSAQEAAGFQVPEEGLFATVAALEELTAATRENTALATTTGPSMEAGLV
jgi:TP901 family phage tail tape measure protein